MVPVQQYSLIWVKRPTQHIKGHFGEDDSTEGVIALKDMIYQPDQRLSLLKGKVKNVIK